MKLYVDSQGIGRITKRSCSSESKQNLEMDEECKLKTMHAKKFCQNF